MRGDTPDRQYSTRLRTALVMTGSGTAGAYHAGVLRALHEAGIRIDLVAGRGIGAIGAMFAAVDGGQRLWDAGGLWKGDALRQSYRWRMPLRVVGWLLIGSCVLLALPLALFAIGVIVGLIAALLSLVSLSAASTSLTSAYVRMLDVLWAPTALPTVVPQLVVFCLIAAIAAMAATVGAAALNAPVRRRVKRGGIWRLIGAPVSSEDLVAGVSAELWNLIRGAAQIAAPPRVELGRKYAELLSENLGQPGFRELLLVAHDMDARRDIVFALLDRAHRPAFFSRGGSDPRRGAEAFDLAGVGRDHAIDALAATVALPLATDAHLLRYAPEGPWRGETHRICDRPGALPRLLEEAALAGAEQVIVVAATPLPSGPHELVSARVDLRGRAAEQLSAFETAGLRDAVEQAATRFSGVYLVQPPHNPLGPLDFAGVYDERSDRRYALGELVDRGYEDAYRQFIEPVVGASGERIETVQS